METVVATIYAGGQEASSANGEPALIISTTSNYVKVCDDTNGGADMSLTVWRPTPTSPGWSILGDYAQGDYGPPTGPSLIVQARNDNPSSPLLMPPTSYTQMWAESIFMSFNPPEIRFISIWVPVAPDGYVTIGFVASVDFDIAPSIPNIPNHVCVRQDLAEIATAGGLIWNDHGTGVDIDVALFLINGVPGTFVAEQSHNDPFTGSAFKLKGYSASSSS